MWCTSHHGGGRSQPGWVQWRSRRITARLSAGGITRVCRPTSSGSEAPAITTRRTEASQAIFRAVSVETGPPWSNSARGPRCQSSRPPGPVSQRLQVHGHGHVGSFASDHGPVGAIQEPPAHLHHRVEAALGGCSDIVWASMLRLVIEHRVHRGQDHVSGLGIAEAIHLHHVEEGHGQMQPPLLTEPLLAVQAMFAFHGLAPVGGDPGEVSQRMDPGGLDERRFGIPECLGSVSLEDTSTLAAETDSSPASIAARVAGIFSNPRAIWTNPRAAPQASLNLEASQETADRHPSRSKIPRCSRSGSLRRHSASSDSFACQSSMKSSSTRASGSSESTSDRKPSSADRSSLTTPSPQGPASNTCSYCRAWV